MGTPDWQAELSAELSAHRPTLAWLPAHLRQLVPDTPVHLHLLNLTSDLCDAGHIHLDIVLWLLADDGLRSIIVSEEHRDLGPESVDTTFETSVSTHPLDTVVGTQLSTICHPDGTQVDVSLAVMLDTPGHTGHADPIPVDDPDEYGYALTVQPGSLSFTVGPELTGALVEFAEALLASR